MIVKKYIQSKNEYARTDDAKNILIEKNNINENVIKNSKCIDNIMNQYKNADSGIFADKTKENEEKKENIVDESRL